MDTSTPSPAAGVEACVRAVLDEFAHDVIWIGFSGGIDSTALLAAACTMIDPQSGIALKALHVHHGLHAAADEWAQHCADLCARLEVPMECVRAHVIESGNMEANARAARYAVFAEHVGKDELLLLGHHEQDQTETLLYRLFQGRGLVPMRERGEIGAGHFARPLLALGRQPLQDYVASRGLSWIEDSSNADTRLTRNFLRHDVIPILAARWRQVHRAVARVAHVQRATETALQHTLGRLGDALELADLPPAGASRQAWLRAYLHTRGVFQVTDKALREFDEQLAQGGHAEMRCLPAALYGYDGCLYFEREPADAQLCVGQLAPGEELHLPGGRLSLRESGAGDRLAFVYPGLLQVRSRRGGERMRVAPQGVSRALKQLLAEARVPPWRRATYPLLYIDDELICVPEIAVGSRVARKPERGEKLCVAVWERDNRAGK